MCRALTTRMCMVLGLRSFARCQLRLSLVSSVLAGVSCVRGTTTQVRDGIGGSWIAFGECDRMGTSQIVAARPDGTERRAITANPAASWFPAWSPAGDRIAYVYELPSGFQIWVIDADGSNNHALMTKGHSLAPAWSHDGKRIAFAHTESTNAAFKIWVMDPNGANAHQVTSTTVPMTDENVPRWSPDGQRLVYTSNERAHYEIWMTDLATPANRRVLTESYFDSSLHAVIEQKVPAWSPDGAAIAYWAGVEASDPRPNLPRDVWIMNADGGEQRRLVEGDDPNWSPDGTTIVYSIAAGATPAIGAVSPSGEHARALFDVRACRSLQSAWTEER